MKTRTPLWQANSAKALRIDQVLRDEFGAGLIETLTRLTDEQQLTVREIAERLTRWTGVSVSYMTAARWARYVREDAA